MVKLTKEGFQKLTRDMNRIAAGEQVLGQCWQRWSKVQSDKVRESDAELATKVDSITEAYQKLSEKWLEVRNHLDDRSR